MRRLFNDGQYCERAERGELATVILPPADRLAPNEAGQVIGTLTQMLSYRDAEGNEVARVHRYLRPDGTIGGSGRPDPKRLLENGVLYRLVKARNR